MKHEVKIEDDTLSKIDKMVSKWLDRIEKIAHILTPWSGTSIFKKRNKT